MTHYSCLSGQGKTTIIATWPGSGADSHSTKVTTAQDRELALDLSEGLTLLSESMWDAAAWLDIYDAAEDALGAIISAAREVAPVPVGDYVDFAGHRHGETLTGQDLARLGYYLPVLLNRLSRTQRLSVVDELAVDAVARAEAIRLLPTGFDPDDDESRVWQAAGIGQVTQAGLDSLYLPEGGAGWVARVFGTDHGPAERWGARNLIHRFEQIESAAITAGLRAEASEDPFVCRVVIPQEWFGVSSSTTGASDAGYVRHIEDKIDEDLQGCSLVEHVRAIAKGGSGYMVDPVVKIQPSFNPHTTPRMQRDVFTTLDILVSVTGSETVNLGTFDPADSDNLTRCLGTWLNQATFRGGLYIAPDQAADAS